MKEIKINLGCGQDFSKELIGIDIYDFGQQYVLDLEKDKLPFEDDSVDYVKAHHFLEHLKDVRNVLNEVWRVLKFTGQFEIWVPYGLWEGAFNPTHHQIITESWFDFLRRDKTKIYGFKQWNILELKRTEIEIYCKMKPKKY